MEIKDNINNIIKEFGLETLPEEEQKEIISRMTESLIKRIIVDTLGKLSDENIKKFEELQENASQEEIDTFLKSNINNYEQVVQKTTEEFKDEMKESITNLKRTLA